MITTIQAIAARVQLCTLRTGAWRPYRRHRKESAAVNKRHGIVNKARVNVTICDDPALLRINAIDAAAYQAHVRLALPSVQEGMRMLYHGRQIEHAETLAAFGRERATYVSDLCARYPQIRIAAQTEL